MSRLHLMFGLVLAGCCAAADLDRDGIPDEWESKIVKVKFADGHTGSIDLRSASPRRKDVIVWITWMDCEGHTHRPIRNLDKASGNSGMALDPTPLSRVVQAFRDSPVLNPDGSKGVNLILLYAEKPLPEVQMLGGVDGNGDYIWDNLEKWRAAQTPVSPPEFAHVVHQCSFIHQMGGSARINSGLSRSIPGMEFLVSLGGADDKVGSPDTQTGTFMHELGHNLGLKHGGADLEILHKPNYLSVLNYLFQKTGLMKDGELGHFEYSQKAFAFDERAVDGRKGVSQDSELVRYGGAEICSATLYKYRYFPSLKDPIAWNCTDDDPSPVVAPIDVNKDGAVQNLTGWNDWDAIIIAPNAPGAGAPTISVPKPATELESGGGASLYAGLTVSGITANRTEQGIAVRWKRVPLSAVVAYELLRTRPGGAPSILRQTKTTEFLDTTAVPGVTYSYQVRLVVSGFSAESIERATGLFNAAQQLLAEGIRSVLSRKRTVGNVLLRARPSRAVQIMR